MASTPQNAAQANERLRIREKIGYGLGDSASNLYWKTFEYFLVYFYTDVFGLTAKATGTMLLVTRIWDAVNDPLIGYLSDRTRSAWGRFRPYLLWMSLPLAITGTLTFYTPDLDDRGKLIYAYITYTLVMMAYTAINVPYGALMGVISPNSLERTSVSTYRFIAAFCGGLVVQYFAMDMVTWLGGGTETRVVDGIEKRVIVDERAGFFWTMAVFSIAAIVLFAIAFLSTKERVAPPRRKPRTVSADLRFVLTSLRLHQIVLAGLGLLALLAAPTSMFTFAIILGTYLAASLVSFMVRRFAISKIPDDGGASSFQQDFDDLLGNGPWKVLFLFGWLQLIGLFVRGGATLYYFKYYSSSPDSVPTFLACGSVASIAGMIVTRPLTARLGKKRLMIALNLGVAMTTLGVLMLSPNQVGMLFALHMVGSFLFGPSPVLMWSMCADTVDYSEWKTHRRATGLVFSAASFSQKMGVAIGAAMTGFALDYYQYLPPVDGIEQIQNATTLTGLRMMMSVIPASFFLLAALCLTLYSIDARLIKQIEADLKGRRPPSE